MSRILNLTSVALAVMLALPAAAAQSNSPAKVFRPVIAELREKVQIPVLLPSKLPTVLRSPDINEVVVAIAAADSYSVGLRYKGVGGEAGSAAWFYGARSDPDAVRAKHPYRLANGALAAFLPVGCGGSCAPANLWWQQDDVVYTIQIVLPPDMAPRAQAKILVETANAMVRVQGGKDASAVTPRGDHDRAARSGKR